MEASAINDTVQKFLLLDCNKHKEKKNGFDYLSWVWAWTEVLRVDPLADFKAVNDPKGNDYWTDGKTARVVVEVTLHGITKSMSLPVMDFRNAAIPVEKLTEVDVNKSIMRCMVKCLAKFGLGLYIYAGEDLPSGMDDDGKGDNGGKTIPPPTNEPTPPQATTMERPKVEKRNQSPKREVNAKAAAAWKAFKNLDAVVQLEDKAAVDKSWQNLLMNTVGKSSAADLTDEEWDKIAMEIDTLSVL